MARLSDDLKFSPTPQMHQLINEAGKRGALFGVRSDAFGRNFSQFIWPPFVTVGRSLSQVDRGQNSSRSDEADQFKRR